MKLKRDRGREGGLRASANGKRQAIDFTFDNWEATNRIVVATNLYQELTVTSDPDTIRAVLAFAKEQGSGWTVPPGGVPVARLYLYFFAGDRPLGNLGVGRTFLSVQHFGSFWSKAFDETGRARLLAILGLEDDV